VNSTTEQHITYVMEKVERNENTISQISKNLEVIARNMIESNVMIILAIDHAFGGGNNG